MSVLTRNKWVKRKFDQQRQDNSSLPTSEFLLESIIKAAKISGTIITRLIINKSVRRKIKLTLNPNPAYN